MGYFALILPKFCEFLKNLNFYVSHAKLRNFVREQTAFLKFPKEFQINSKAIWFLRSKFFKNSDRNPIPEADGFGYNLAQMRWDRRIISSIKPKYNNLLSSGFNQFVQQLFSCQFVVQNL